LEHGCIGAYGCISASVHGYIGACLSFHAFHSQASSTRSPPPKGIPAGCNDNIGGGASAAAASVSPRLLLAAAAACVAAAAVAAAAAAVWALEGGAPWMTALLGCGSAAAVAAAAACVVHVVAAVRARAAAPICLEHTAGGSPSWKTSGRCVHVHRMCVRIACTPQMCMCMCM
jgi:hypothetical protein